MSKAFTRESDDEAGDPPRVRPPLPPGVVNRITPGGADRLRAKLGRLRELKKNGHDAVEQPIRVLQEILGGVVVTPPPLGSTDRVGFGAAVKVRDALGDESWFRLVGVDELDVDRGEISWLSPLARALLSRRVGDQIRFRSPAGEQQLVVLEIRYG